MARTNSSKFAQKARQNRKLFYNANKK